MTSRLAPRTAAIAMATALLGAVVMIAALALQYLELRESVWYRCTEDSTPPSALVSETALLDARATLLPIGRLCIFRPAVGAEPIVVQTGFLLTGVVVAVSLLALLVSVWAAHVARREGRGTLPRALLPLIVVVIGWMLLSYAPLSSTATHAHADLTPIPQAQSRA